MVREYGYEYDAALDENLWKSAEGKVTDKSLFGARCLRSGRDALKAIAREFDPCVALIPALACDSMVFPFELYGHKVRYYKLGSDYSIDPDDLELGDERVLFLYMDYFGRRAIEDAELEKLRSRFENIIFIEDRTHNLIRERGSSFQPDYIIASLRKWIAIPDGGLLWGSVTKPLGADTSFSRERLRAQCMRREYLERGDERIKTEYRRIFSTVSDIMDRDEPSAMSAYSYELARRTNWDEIRRARFENSAALIEVLSTSPHVKLIQDKPGQSDLYVPFTVQKRDEVQRRLSALGIFNTIIWPLADIQKSVCATAAFTEENMLAAPCDQRYTKDDIIFLGREIMRIAEDVNR